MDPPPRPHYIALMGTNEKDMSGRGGAAGARPQVFCTLTFSWVAQTLKGTSNMKMYHKNS